MSDQCRSRQIRKQTIGVTYELGHVSLTELGHDVLRAGISRSLRVDILEQEFLAERELLHLLQTEKDRLECKERAG